MRTSLRRRASGIALASAILMMTPLAGPAGAAFYLPPAPGAGDAPADGGGLQQATAVETAAVEDANPATTVAYSPDGAAMAVGGQDGSVFIYETASSALIRTLSGHVGAEVTGLAFSPKGDLLATAGRDSTVQLWKTSDWSHVRTLNGHEQAVRSLAFSPDGSELVTGGEDTRTLRWSVTTGKLQGVLGGAKDFVTAVAITPDGTTLAIGTADSRITLRDAKTHKQRGVLRGHTGAVTSLAFSPDSRTMASGSLDKTAKLWDVKKASETRDLRGHGGAVTSVAFQPDGKGIASGSKDGTIRIWDTEKGSLRTQLGGSSSPVNDVAFAPNDSKLLEGDAKGTASVWDLTDSSVDSATTLPEPAPAKSRSEKSSPGAKVSPAAFAAPTALNPAPGGPVLVITNTTDRYSSYLTEILRAEGLNSFGQADLASVTASTLAGYEVALLGATTLTADQATMFTTWVNAGGNLVAMKPDSRLSSLLGLSTPSGTLANAYLKVDTSSSPGSGIVSDTIQFHGTADRYTLAGARAVATLYSSATTATSNPAVTLRSVGSSGGDAAAFTYDLARSVVYTRQGNPAWAGQERDGIAPRRSDDMFFGGSDDDWIDLDKVAIPQADEQQRLLVNLIQQINADKTPLPRFWYLPKGLKAAVVMTGDDHANGGTIGRFDQLAAASDPACAGTGAAAATKVANWECLRGTSYVFPNTPMSNAEADKFVKQGFEVGLHLNTNCSNFTAASVAANWDDQLGDWQAKYASVPKPLTNRTHCIAWSDWSTMASESRAEGVRMDTNYYYWPPSWNQDRPGFFTGSGIPMRFADSSGAMLDIYQAASQMTDESGQSYPYTVDTLLDRALGSQQFFGAFTINAHTDVGQITESVETIASAKERGVPIISAKQLLDWTDGRNSSAFESLNWVSATNKLTFSVAPGAGAKNLTMLVPSRVGTRSLNAVTRNGSQQTFETRVIKGVSYALVTAAAGDYEANYGADTTAPTVTATSPANGATGVAVGAPVTATFSEEIDPATVTSSTVELRTSAGAVVPATVTYDAAAQRARLVPTNALGASATYTATVKGGGTDPTIRDAAGNALASTKTWTFTTAAPPPEPSCPCSIWPNTAVPANPTDNDPNAVELGVKFQSDVAGYITGVRFWKGPQNTGTHTGNLWSSTGTKLATATFSGETASGWQQVTFNSPVAISANTAYVASYHTTSGMYAADSGFFASQGVDNAPLHALRQGVSGNNGLYAYGASQFPSQSWGASNYWVDVTFTTNTGSDTTAPVVTSVSPAENATGVATSSGVTATFNEPLDPATVTSSTAELRKCSGAPASCTSSDPLVATTVTYDAALRQVVIQPNASLTASTSYTATVKGGTGAAVKDTAGNALAANKAWTFTTATLADTTAPTVTSVSPAENATGVATNSAVTATFSEAINAATVTSSTVELRTSSGAVVPSTVTYNATNRQARLVPNSALATSTTYTVNVKGGGTDPTIRDLAGNALASTKTWTFSTAAAPDTTAPTVTAVSPADKATGVATDTAVTATFSEAINAATVTTSTVELRTSAGAVVPATVTYDATARQARLVPTGALAASATYTVNVNGGGTDPTIRDLAGNALAATKTWTFTTSAASACPCTSIWPVSAEPSNPTVQDSDAVELGVKFQSDVAGYITGIRFWKGPQNTGTHTGNLWSSTGTKLATATFSGETAVGWQQVTFSQPVQISADTTYVASYHTTSGMYSGDNNFFASLGVDNAPLHALPSGVSGDNGVYAYGASQFPTQSWQHSNYWVDVSFTSNATGPDTTAPVVTSVSPAENATGVATNSGVTATFNEPLDPTTVTSGTAELRKCSGAPATCTASDPLVSATVTYDSELRQVVIQPNANLTASTSYTATVKGGAGAAVKDAAGNALATNKAWTFTTAPAGDTTAPTVTAVTPAENATGVATNSAVTATFSEAINAATVTTSTVEVRTSAGAVVPSTVTYNATTRQARLVPNSALAASATYTVNVKGGGTDPTIRDTSGNALAATKTWTFTTAGGSSVTSIWPISAEPSNPTEQDPAAVELGVKFQSDVAGYITGVRFWKGPQNTGTHTGNLWSSTGTKLATATFSNETAVGWQQVTFSQPVQINANTTYVASYHTTSGMYSGDNNFFASLGVDNAPLHALRSGVSGSNGVYAYGASQFPTESWLSSNYWVDVVFTTNP